MTLVATAVPVPVIGSRILGVPHVARIITRPLDAAVDLNPEIGAILFAPEQLAAVDLQAMPAKTVSDCQRERYRAEPAERPTVRRVVAKHIDHLCVRGHHV